MPLDPVMAEFLRNVEAGGSQPLAETPIEQSRAFLEMLNALGQPPDRPVATEDREVPGPGGGIPVRIYRPEVEGNASRPTIAFFHGGGWVLGGIASHDTVCRRLAADIPAVVVSVDYRLAPEHPYPAAVEDCEAATRWCAAGRAGLGGEGGAVAVVGDSAGGNLAAVVARRCRDAGGPTLAAQVLIYPCTDMTWSHESRRSNGEGYLLTADDMRWFEDRYLVQASRQDPDVSPLLAADLSALPPALVITAEFDPLRDEGEAYADRLVEADVTVALSRYDGMIHGFFGMDSVTDAASRAAQEVAETLGRLLRPAGYLDTSS